MTFKNFSLKMVLFFVGLVMLVPQSGHAIPAFARKYGVKCYQCHTIPPALNKNGYMFKRLGYRMPPDEMDGTKPAPKITELDKDIQLSMQNIFAVILNASVSTDKVVQDPGTPSADSATSINLDEAALFVTGNIPNTGFSTFVHYEMYQGGSNNLEQGFGVYTGGRANSSYFVKVGEIHMQEGEGTRVAFFYNLFSDPSLTLTNTDPINFTLDQHPAGIDAGYTWASPYFKNIFAISGKVTNGLNADGSEILDSATRNSKDVWADADYWFGPDGGVTVMMYRGAKDQVQTDSGGNQFTYRPTFYRVGAFGNYLFFDKLDVLGGFIHAQDDWQTVQGGTMGHYTSNSVRGEVDYYMKTGTVAMVRFDRLAHNVTGGPTMHSEAFGIGAERALTPLGNVVLRAAYTQEHDADPVAVSGSTDKNFKLDIRYMW
jgi:hypothetical protein